MIENTYIHLCLDSKVVATLTDYGKAVAKYNLLELHDFVQSAWYESECIRLGLHTKTAVVTLPFLELLKLLEHPESSLKDMINGDIRVIAYEYDKSID